MWFKFLISIPWLYSLALYLFVIRASIKLGYFPSYDSPDPKDLHFDLHHKITWNILDYGIWLNLFCLILVIGLLLFKRNFAKNNKIGMGVYGLGIAFVLYILFLDPFLEWFLD